MLDSDHQVQYEFDRFTVDPKQRLLFVAGDSTPVDLPPRAFDALLYLAQRPGELLSKSELLGALWPHVVVEENSLNQLISLVRKVLGERPSEHRFIVTAPGRGYRFVAAVRVKGTDKQTGLERDGLSIAILPFTDHSRTLGNGYLGDAIAADLSRLLSARSRIRVATPASSSVFKSSSANVQTIATTLNVARVLQGHIGEQGDQLMVTVRLIDATTGTQMRTVSQTRHVRELVELQADLAREIARILDPDSGATVLNDSSVAPESYLQYLRALSLSMQPNEGAIRKAITVLHEAIDRNPLFARAKSLLAIQYTSCLMFGFPVPGALDLARHEVAGALTMDDQNGETHCAAAVIDCLGGAWSRAEERFRIAHSLTADPLVSGLRCAYLSLSVGQLERALHQAEHALRVAPTHPIGVHLLAALHMMMGQDALALRYANLAVELGQSRVLAPLVDVFPGLALRAGCSADAADYMTAAFPARARTSELARAVHLLCRPSLSPAESGEAAAAIRVMEEFLTADELDPPMRKRLLLWYVRSAAIDRAFDLAFRSLDHFARDGTVGGAWGVLWLPEMSAFRADDRFALFARRLRLFEYWSEYGPPDGYALDADRLSRAG